MREKRIVLVNDVTGLSRCSVACQLPIISAMGIETAFVPTAILSINTYHKDFFFDDYTSKMNDYIETYKKMNIDFDGICSGFLGSAKQIEIVKEFFKDFKTEKNFILVDPVMGDHGKLYPTYTREMQEKMRELMPYAAIVTPNLTELCALIDEAYHETSNEQELKRMCEKLSQMGPKMRSRRYPMMRGTMTIENESITTNYKSLMDNNLNARSSIWFFSSESVFTRK